MVNLDLPILNRVKNILTKTEKIDTDVTNILAKLAEQGVDIDSIITSIGTSGDQASVATIFGKLAALASQSGGVVKSVQTGIATYKPGSLETAPSSAVLTINISNINPNKSMVILSPRYYSFYSETGYSLTIYNVSLVSLQTNQLQVNPSFYTSNDGR